MRRWQAVKEWFFQLFWKQHSARRIETVAVVKAQIPHATFTKRLTPHRKKHLLRVLRWMTLGQRRIARDRGWDRGLLHETADGKLLLP